jgi:hypothetical protein
MVGLGDTFQKTSLYIYKCVNQIEWTENIFSRY